MDEKCSACQYWKPFGDKTGECRCKAPLPYLVDPKNETFRKEARWPLTMADQGCGEFKAKSHYGATLEPNFKS